MWGISRLAEELSASEEWPCGASGCIQGNSQGMVNILEVDNIGHCAKENSYEHLSNSEWLPKQSCLNVHTLVQIQKHCKWQQRKRNYTLLILF